MVLASWVNMGLRLEAKAHPLKPRVACGAEGFATVVANSDEDATLQHQVIISMLEHGVSAILISPSYGDTKTTFDAIRRSHTPTLQVLRTGDRRIEDFPFYSIDYTSGSMLAVDHLLSQGLRDIAFVGGVEGRQITMERMSGYLAGMKRAGLEAPTFFGRNTREFGRDIGLEIVKTHPHIKAAICFNDMVALGMMSAMARSDIKVGQDFFLIGFDDIRESALFYPTLSSVHCDIEGFGQRSAHLLLSWLASGEQPDDPGRAGVHLEIRQSSTVPI
ncbi:substrate-binding domain-containing protein [Roseicitreum antarcticum]|uniref:Transcriptional regulator, LacI family n=1 Tax=Roseicitreum antarcticum TaxID=564137 RepID=A0A1H2U6K9_9RHOB|nr:substrate-binding domain-containing protein [Roseicitreum antarcticum]SDW51508.1 transcriptional regulator, LacI family [Roseicitreum antarcticum]